MPKRVFKHMRTAKARISLCIRAVWSGPSLFPNRLTGYYKMFEWRGWSDRSKAIPLIIRLRVGGFICDVWFVIISSPPRPSPSFCASGKICFVIMAFSWYLHLKYVYSSQIHYSDIFTSIPVTNPSLQHYVASLSRLFGMYQYVNTYVKCIRLGQTSR